MTSSARCLRGDWCLPACSSCGVSEGSVEELGDFLERIYVSFLKLKMEEGERRVVGDGGAEDKVGGVIRGEGKGDANGSRPEVVR